MFRQVAEMHGEIMEFNSYLSKQLYLKNQQLARLKEDLVDLRGPVRCVLIYLLSINIYFTS